MYGYDALLLPKVCGVYIDADADEALWKSQEHIARRASVLVRGLAEIGIIQLVDEATGYDEQKAEDELVELLGH